MQESFLPHRVFFIFHTFGPVQDVILLCKYNAYLRVCQSFVHLSYLSWVRWARNLPLMYSVIKIPFLWSASTHVIIKPSS